MRKHALIVIIVYLPVQYLPCLFNPRRLETIHIVAGGGVQGLLKAISLIKQNHRVLLIEGRQEIGIPCAGVGLIEEEKNINYLLSLNPPPQLQIFQSACGWGLRLEWLEKFLAQYAGDIGVEIHLKMRIESFTTTENGFRININGVAPGDPTFFEAEYLHDCLGDQPFYIGEKGSSYVLGRKPNNELIEWSGVISIPENLPEEWSHNGWDGTRMCFPRADGTIECWMKGPRCLPKHPNGWLEKLSAKLPNNATQISLDYAF